MKDILALDSMLTPRIITFVYWLLLLLVAFSGLQSMFGGYGGFRFEKFLTGLVIIVAGGVAARIWCELLIVLFKIHENIKKLTDRQDGQF